MREILFGQKKLTGLYVSLLQHLQKYLQKVHYILYSITPNLAVEVFITFARILGSIPCFAPKFIASQTPAIDIARAKLLAIFSKFKAKSFKART